MHVEIEASWKEQLKDIFVTPYFTNLMHFVKQEYQQHTVYPPEKSVFNAFSHCYFNEVKVVIIGQDPYHGPNQAHGLCFSVNDGVKIPPSLVNIFKELKLDLGIEPPTTGNLEHWAKQGVLLLNATLTVRAHQAGSHQKKGWEKFTDDVIQHISDKKENVVFILWGAYAQKKGTIIDQQKHYVIKSAHPSPLSAYNGFWNSKPFSKTNDFLISKGLEEIKW